MEAIYAIDSKGGIGLNGSIPWNSTKDLKFFYQKTKSNIVIMGSLRASANKPALSGQKNFFLFA